MSAGQSFSKILLYCLLSRLELHLVLCYVRDSSPDKARHANCVSPFGDSSSATVAQFAVTGIAVDS